MAEKGLFAIVLLGLVGLMFSMAMVWLQRRAWS